MSKNNKRKKKCTKKVGKIFKSSGLPNLNAKLACKAALPIKVNKKLLLSSK